MAKRNSRDKNSLQPEESSSLLSDPTKKRDIIAEQKEEARDKFKIAQSDKGLSGLNSYRQGGLLEQDPSSFKDAVVENAARKRIKKYSIFLGSVAFLLILAWAIVTLMPSNDVKDNVSPESMPPLFLELYPQAPEANVPEMSLNFNGHTIETLVGKERGHNIEVDSVLFQPLKDCKLVQTKDFKRCGLGEDEAGLKYGLWFIKDGAHSKLFNTATELEQLEVPGAPAAASMLISGFSAQPSPAVVVITPDSAGYMIVLPAESTQADIELLVKGIRVK